MLSQGRRPALRWLKHAFALDPPGPAEPSDEERLVVDRLCRYVHQRHLTAPARLLLESTLPLNFITSQVLHFFAPLVSAVTDTTGYSHFAGFLERRGAVEYLCQRLDELEKEHETHGGGAAAPATDLQRDNDDDDEEL